MHLIRQQVWDEVVAVPGELGEPTPGEGGEGRKL